MHSDIVKGWNVNHTIAMQYQWLFASINLDIIYRTLNIQIKGRMLAAKGQDI
jgi:hypothetical protein